MDEYRFDVFGMRVAIRATGTPSPRWADASPNAAKEGFTMQQLEARLDAHRAALQDDFLAKPRVTQQKRCDAYPQLLLSRTLDLEKSQADLVRSVRAGPR